MGDVAVAQPVEILYLLPNRLVTLEEFDVRGGDVVDPADEERKVENLALSMEHDGQQDDLIVIPNHEPDRFVIIAGHRRKRAAAKINERRTLIGKELFRLRARVERGNGVDRFRQAVISNLHREDFGPMGLARLIERIRVKLGCPAGYKGALQVAKYLSVDPATVTQHEKFLAAPKEIQLKLASRELTAQGAFLLLDVKPEKRDEVMAVAREVQKQADAKRDEARGNRPVRPPVTKAEGRIEHPAVIKAIRKVEGSSDKPIPATRKEILEIIEELDGPAYGYPDSAVRVWARYFVDRWAKGIGSDRTLREKFDAVAAKSSRGTKSASGIPDKPKKSR